MKLYKYMDISKFILSVHAFLYSNIKYSISSPVNHIGNRWN